MPYINGQPTPAELAAGGVNTGGIGGGPSPQPAPAPTGPQNPAGASAASAFPWQEAYERALEMLANIPIQQVREDAARRSADAAQVRYNELFTGEGGDPSKQWSQADAWANAQLRLAEVAGQEAGKSRVPALPDPGSGNTASGSKLSPQDMANALNQLRQGINGGNQQLLDILNNPTNDPNARDTFNQVQTWLQPTATAAAPVAVNANLAAAGEKPIAVTATAKSAIQTANAKAAEAIAAERAQASGPAQVTQAQANGAARTTDASAVGPTAVSEVGPAARLQAAQQRGTTVAGTGLDTSQTDQARTISDRAISDLEATARGEGAGQIAARERSKAALAQAAAAAQGLARTARGPDRKAALVQAQTQAQEQGVQAASQLAAQEAQERQAAQSAIGAQAQQTRQTDLQVASKRAELDSQRNVLQAQLDAARAANDQAAVLSTQAKMAELDTQIATLNASAKNSAAESYAARATQIAAENAKAKNAAEEAAAGRQTTVAVENARALTASQEAAAARATAVALANAQANNAALESAAGRTTSVDLSNVAAQNAALESAAERQTRVSQQNALSQTGNNQQQADRAQQIALANQAAQNDLGKFNTTVLQGNEQFNANASNQVNTANADRVVNVQSLNNTQGLAANVAGSQQDIGQAELVIKVQKAIEDSAKGILDENERQQTLAMARRRLELAEKENNREQVGFWTQLIGKLLERGASAAVGAGEKWIISDRRSKEKVEKVTRKDVAELRKAMQDSMSTYVYQGGKGLPEGPQVSPMAQDVAATKLGKALVKQGGDGFLKLDLPRATAILAAFNISAKKKAA
jgi:hypothetical protein